MNSATEARICQLEVQSSGPDDARRRGIGFDADDEGNITRRAEALIAKSGRGHANNQNASKGA